MIDMQDENVIKMPMNFEPIQNGLGVEYFKKMQQFKNKIGQINAETGEIDTFGSMLRRAVLTAINLRNQGITQDDIVCICSYNHFDNCIPLIASLFLNVKVASLDPSLSQVDTVHLIKQVQPKIFFISDNAVELIENSMKDAQLNAKIVVFGESDTHQSFEHYLIGDESEMEDFQPVQVDDLFETAIIFFSSGTTGLPKGICLTHYCLGCQAVNLANTGILGGVLLSYSSLYWISAVMFLTGTVFNGSTRLICRKFDPNELWWLIERYKVKTLFSAPSQALAMYKAGRPDNINTTNLLYFVVGGGPLSVHRLLAIRDVLPGTIVCQFYGQTEIGGILTAFNFTDVQDTLLLNYRPASCGRPVPGFQYKVADLETEKVCGPNERGELRVKSKFVMKEYFNMDTSGAYDDDGWLRTGDVVYYDEDHCFYVVDRIKEMLKYKSWHVAPATLEMVISNHPAVKQVVVIGVPDEEDGDHPMAVVVLYDGRDDVTAEEVENFVAERVDERQRLRAGVKFIDSIPLTATGKIKKKLIRDLVLAGEI